LYQDENELQSPIPELMLNVIYNTCGDKSPKNSHGIYLQAITAPWFSAKGISTEDFGFLNMIECTWRIQGSVYLGEKLQASNKGL
jgi:hypothetical protein